MEGWRAGPSVLLDTMTIDPRRQLTPLVLATLASQALLVVLSPTIAVIATEFRASTPVVGQARSVTAAAAILTSVAIASRVEVIGVRRLLLAGGALGAVACAAVAAAWSVPALMAAHGLVGISFACLLSAGFSGVAAFPAGRRAWAVGYVAGANALAWIIVNPSAGFVTQWLSWRAAEAVPAALCVLAVAWSLPGNVVVEATPTGAARTRLILQEPSARAWIASELVAYGAWTAFLTFSGAFFTDTFGLKGAQLGWLLAVGPAAYFASSTRIGMLLSWISRRTLIAVAAMAMGALLLLMLDFPGSLLLAGVVYCLVGAAAGVRTPVSSGLGMDQLPGHPGVMMSARTATTQLGYMIGAVAGGGALAVGGYAALGVAMAAGMLVSVALLAGVHQAGSQGPASAPDVRPLSRARSSSSPDRVARKADGPTVS